MTNESPQTSAVPLTLAHWVEKGHALKSRSLLAEAVEAYLHALQIDGAHADSWRFLGNAYYNLGQFPQARKAYEISSLLDPDEPKIWMNLANTYAHLRMQPESESCRNRGHAMIASNHSKYPENK